MNLVKLAFMVFCLLLGYYIWNGYETSLVTLAPKTIPTPNTGNSIVINPDKTIILNGKKTFPLMFYSFCGDDASAGECLSNLQLNTPYDIDLVGGYNSDIYNNYLTAYASTGKYFVSQALVNDTYNNYFRVSSNNFFGYYQPEEPTDANHVALKNTYDTLHATDPNHIVITGLWKSAAKWSDTADVMIAGNYPFVENWSASYDPQIGRDKALYGYEYIEETNTLLGTTNFDTLSKPLWPVIQAVGCTDEAGVRPISKTELRALTYTAITFNVKGLSYYSYRWTPNGCGLNTNPSLVTDYINVAKEVKSFNNILVLPTTDYSWEYRKGTQVSFDKTLTNNLYGNPVTNFNYMLKQSNGVTYLFIVNKDINPISNVGITISGLSGTMTATTLGLSEAGSVPGRTLAVNNGKFTDSFDGYAVHIYKIS